MAGKKTRIVMAGCGGIVGAWLRPFANFADGEIVGLVDLNPDAAAAVKEKFKLAGAAVGTDLAAMLAELRPDAVFDCTVPVAHRNVTVTALEHGCHVLGEKPMAETMDDAREMLAAAEQAGKIYAVIQNRRYLDPIIRFRDFVQSGSIGELHTLHADFFIGAHFDGFRAEMPHVLLLDMAIHSFDQARFISDADPVAVIAYDWNPAGSWYAHGASAVAVFEMSSGITFSYRGSWCSEGLNTSWECDWRAIGTKGSSCWNGAEKFAAETPDGKDGLIWPQREIDIPEQQGLELCTHAAIIREFLDCIQLGGTPQTVCSDNIKSLAMVHAAIASAESKQEVKIKI